MRRMLASGLTILLLVGVCPAKPKKEQDCAEACRVASLSMRASQSYLDDPLCQATSKLYEAGIVTVASAGNFGQAPGSDTGEPSIVYGSITSPATSPRVISVGATDHRGTLTRTDDVVASFSSRGPTRGYDQQAGRYDHLLKPEIVAPGVDVAALLPPARRRYRPRKARHRGP
ncbi:MAG: S8 family serine peptidase [Acidobacteriota bacterium]|nr:MAG: S8 family serine peptidase [Acidobacteriota bacterium]